MTDDVNMEGAQESNVPASSGDESLNAAAESQEGSEQQQGETGQAEQPQEKMIPSSQVSKIVASQAREAADKARKQALEEYQREQQAGQQHAGQQQQVGNMNPNDPNQIRQLIREEAQRLAQLEMAQQIESDFERKINAEMTQDPEFAEVYKAMNLEAHPEIVIWANGFDNTAAVIKELGNNPSKYSSVIALAKSGMPKLAENELKKISSSIKANEEAKQQPKAPEPLGQMKPSGIGADNGQMEVSDFRNADWLRG